MKPVNSYVGTPVKRLEDLRFLTGRGQYVGDLKRENLLHAVILRSPIAHGVIVAIDTARARALPGVQAVITAADIGTPVPRIPMRQEPMPELLRCEQPVIAEGKVRYAGEPVALVVAESADRAEDALQAIEFSLEALPAVVDGRAPLHGGEWAMATMEACYAMLQSAKEQREIPLRHQTGLTTIGA